MMMSAAENYAKANNVSTQEAYNKLMDISNQGSLSAGVKTTLGGGINIGVAKWGLKGIFQRMHAIQRGVHAGFRIQAHIPGYAT